MKKYYCNGKKGYCDKGNDANIICIGCEFVNGTGGEIVDCPDTITADEQKEILKEAIKHYGADLQVTVAIEEMSELIKELCKAARYKADHANIAEEIADVSIMLEQLKIIFEISPAAIENIKEYKLHRLESRIFNEKRLKENGCK